MLRLTFAAAAGFGCMLIGMNLARRLTRREEAINAWLRLLEGLSAALGYVDDPLPDVLERLASNDSPGDARLAAAIMESVQLMRQDRSLSFADALPIDKAFADMNSSDSAPLTPLIRELGATARPQQTARIESAQASMRTQATQASERAHQQKRLYVSLGSLGGLALFLCLIG